MVLLQIQLGRVFNGDDPLAVGMYEESALSIVVLPDPVPPEMTILSVQ